MFASLVHSAFEFSAVGTVAHACPHCGGDHAGLRSYRERLVVLGLPTVEVGSGYTLGCAGCGMERAIERPEGERLHLALLGGRPPRPRTAVEPIVAELVTVGA